MVVTMLGNQSGQYVPWQWVKINVADVEVNEEVPELLQWPSRLKARTKMHQIHVWKTPAITTPNITPKTLHAIPSSSLNMNKQV